MTITEYCDALNITLSILYYANQDNRWCAQFERCEVKGDGVLIGAHGNGDSPAAAISDYLNQIVGKTIVLRAGTSSRQEFVVPISLHGGDVCLGLI